MGQGRGGNDAGEQLLGEMCAVGGGGRLAPVRDYVFAGSRLVAEVEADPVATIEFVAAGSQVGEASGSAAPLVRLVTAAALTGPMTVRYTTSDGTAAAGADYTATSSSVTFPQGSANGAQLPLPVAIPILNDQAVEANETLTIALSDPTCGAGVGAIGAHTLTILDDDPLVETVTVQDEDPTAVVSAASLGVVEGASGTTDAAVSVSLDRGSEWSPSVSWATGDGTALSGSDYYAANGTVTFGAGVTTALVHAGVVGDRLSEGSETFVVNLSSPTNLALGGNGTVTITDDDVAPGLSVEDASVSEGGTVQATIRLWPWQASAVDVDYQTVAGTATSPEDFQAVSGVARFVSGATSVQVPILTVLDGGAELPETFTAELSNASGAPIASGVGTVKVLERELGVDFDGDQRGDIVWRQTTTGQAKEPRGCPRGAWYRTGSRT